jgi:hypothetical protein
MKHKTKSKSKPQTLAQLAKVLGVSRQLLNAHRRKPDAPKLSDVDGWIVWLSANGRDGSAPPELRKLIAAERLAILKETKARLARENAREAGELMPVADAKRFNAEAWSFIFDRLEHLCLEKPPALAGRTAIEIFEQLSEFKEKMRRDAKEKFTK